MKSGIYKILNTVTEKFYIGSAVNFKARWTAHKSSLNRRDHKNKALQASWDLHGEIAFEFIVLEYCDRSKLPEREQYWIDETKCCDRNVGYNLYAVAGSPLGTKWTEERKEKARARMKDFRHTPETIQRMRDIQSQRSKQTCAKISAAKMGHDVSEVTRRKIGAANSHPHTEAHIRARSKIDKWPHGYVCKCNECRNKKADYHRNWKRLKKEVISNVQA